MASTSSKVQIPSQTQTSSSVSGTTQRERRPFLWISPVNSHQALPADFADGLVELEAWVGADVQILVRSLVNYSVASQNRRSREAGRSVGTTLSILNRRRRAARAWSQAILAGQMDEPTLRSMSHTWLPQLAGTGPDIALAVPAGREFLEFLKGTMTALVMSQASASLVPQAKALQALETVLGVHLRAMREVEFRAEDPAI
jgi:hypothetical protein